MSLISLQTLTCITRNPNLLIGIIFILFSNIWCVYKYINTFCRFTRNPVRLFVIISMQRSGSGWFESLLNNHMNIRLNDEIFGPKNRRQNLSSNFNTLDRVYSMGLITYSSQNSCSAAINFKWMLHQVTFEVRIYHYLLMLFENNLDDRCKV